jgi:hypothetical protein
LRILPCISRGVPPIGSSYREEKKKKKKKKKKKITWKRMSKPANYVKNCLKRH